MIVFEPMLSAPVHAVALVRHASTPNEAVRGVAASVSRLRGGGIAVSYVVDGDLGRLRVPAPRPPRRADGLWEHTCCEIFIARAGSAAYHEFNFSPSGEWAAYAFDGYRVPRAAGPAPEMVAPEMTVRKTGSRLELDAVLRLDRLGATYPGAPLSISLAAVIEEAGGTLSCWALRHPPGKPDFHHREAFALDLAAVGG